MTSPLLDPVRLVVGGGFGQVVRCLAESPALAAASAPVGATRQERSTFFIADITH